MQATFKRGVGLNLRLDHLDAVIEQRPKVPFFEVIVDNWFSPGPHHKKLEKIRQDYEILFHCVGMNLGGIDNIKKSYLEKVKVLEKKFKPHHISDHLCFQANKLNYHHDLLPFPFNKEAVNNTVDRIKYAQDFLNQRILVENLSYYIEFKSSDMEEVDFLNEVTENSDSYILLDLNNIWVNSQNINLNIKNYINKINWSRVGEIHLAGAEKFGQTFVDTHGTYVHDDVLNLAKTLQDEIKNLPITYERDSNIPPFNELLRERSLIQERIFP